MRLQSVVKKTKNQEKCGIWGDGACVPIFAYEGNRNHSAAESDHISSDFLPRLSLYSNISNGNTSPLVSPTLYSRLMLYSLHLGSDNDRAGGIFITVHPGLPGSNHYAWLGT